MLRTSHVRIRDGTGRLSSACQHRKKLAKQKCHWVCCGLFISQATTRRIRCPFWQLLLSRNAARAIWRPATALQNVCQSEASFQLCFSVTFPCGRFLLLTPQRVPITTTRHSGEKLEFTSCVKKLCLQLSAQRLFNASHSRHVGCATGSDNVAHQFHNTRRRIERFSPRYFCDFVLRLAFENSSDGFRN